MKDSSETEWRKKCSGSKRYRKREKKVKKKMNKMSSRFNPTVSMIMIIINDLKFHLKG